jgi:hypothetical protein
MGLKDLCPWGWSLLDEKTQVKPIFDANLMLYLAVNFVTAKPDVQFVLFIPNGIRSLLEG